MYVLPSIILHLSILSIIQRTNGLVELPQVEENDIIKAEAIIRSTTNKIFSSMKLIGVKKYPRLEQYRLIHNFFVSLTLQDYKGLKEIARLSRIDKNNINNRTTNFIDLLNEVLNEDNHIEEVKEGTSNTGKYSDDLAKYIDGYLNKLSYLKYFYGSHSPNTDINKDILTLFENSDFKESINSSLSSLNSSISEELDALLNENDFWVDPEKSGRRIFKGKVTKIKHYPFMASLHIFDQFQCGGSIISEDLIISAASCLQLAYNNRLYRENPSFLSVRIGSSYYNGGEKIPVIEVFFYPEYNPKNLRNNLALLRLGRRINFYKAKSKVKRILLDTSGAPLAAETDGITIVGWGAKLTSGILRSPWDQKLSYSVLDLYELKGCQEIYSKEFVTWKNFCAGYLSKGSGACNRDVGGPGIIGGLLTGVVSFGSPVCGAPNAPTVFTKIGFYAEWIEEIMEKVANLTPYKIKPTSRTYPPSIFPTAGSTPEPTWIMEPMSSGTEAPAFDSLDSLTSVRPILRDDVGLFKTFLKTMFASKEIDQYIDLTQPNKNYENNKVVEELKHQLEQDNLHHSQQNQPKSLRYDLKADKGPPMDTKLVNMFESYVQEGNPLNERKPMDQPLTLTFVMGGNQENPIIDTDDHVEIRTVSSANEARKELESDLNKIASPNNTHAKDTDRFTKPASKPVPITVKNEIVEVKESAHKEIDDAILTLLYVVDNRTGDGGIKIFEKGDEWINSSGIMDLKNNGGNKVNVDNSSNIHQNFTLSLVEDDESEDSGSSDEVGGMNISEIKLKNTKITKQNKTKTDRNKYPDQSLLVDILSDVLQGEELTLNKN